MNKTSWLIALVALVLGAGAAVAITQGLQEDSTVAAPPTQSTETEKAGGSGDEGSKDSGEEKKDADDQKAAEQQVEQTVNAYVEALEQGDTEALCNIQAESFTVKVTASGVSGEEIAEACAEAASEFDWAELWAAWASQVGLEDVEVDIHGADAKVSLVGGGSFSLDRQKSGEWKIDGVRLPTGGSGGDAPQGPGGGGRPTGGDVPSGGSVPRGGSGDLPNPEIPQSPQLPQLPQR
ncbi:MAG TPA: hypothetical protein VEW07_09920 [Solirubrobacterales bacterium]|nr:hypothetical protein [Solirubrobacterales bacterium]